MPASLIPAQQAVLDAIRADATIARPPPLPTSPWVAKSLLQKAIRRGLEQPALRAAATLLEKAPETLWRRLCGIAFEDIGLADIEAVAAATTLVAKTERAVIGEDWHVASHLVARLVRATKSRAVDDLLMLSERHPSLASDRQELYRSTDDELISVALSERPLPRRAVAVQYAVGVWRSPFLYSRKGDYQQYFDQLLIAGYPPESVELARLGFRRTRQMLCPILALISPLRRDAEVGIIDDEFPPEEMCGPVPSWAIDMYSREGRHALVELLNQDCHSSVWIRKNVRSQRRVTFLGNLLFSIEGQLMRRRETSPLAEGFRQAVTIECQGPDCADATEILALLREDLPLLNQVRADVV